MSRTDRPLFVEVLGPLRVRAADGRDITPSGVLQRRLLALFVLHRGVVVSTDAVADALWPSSLPREPNAAIQNHVSRLRRTLPDGALESIGDGYRFDSSSIDVDADRLADLTTVAPDELGALTEIEAILTRWHGPAYPELDELDDARAEANRLEEIRVRAREVRAEIRIAHGDTDGLAAELAALTAAAPLSERPRSLLMRVLEMTGRRADALRAFDDFRRLLGDELGIEPSPALIAQHAELLVGDEQRGSPWRSPTRLPSPTSSLIGRDSLASTLSDQVADVRLTTLVGPGGVGKTRVLLDVGRRLAAAKPGRTVVLCELASADVNTAADHVAGALGIDGRPGVPPTDRISEVLGDSDVVLLLDNCEHVLEPTAELVERVMARCPNLRILATSRERLRVAGEHTRTVPTLAVDDAASPSVRLFVDRARAASPDFAPDAADLARVVEIVRRLDGLPLAIELAAARLHTHTVAEVAAGLDRPLSMLTSGSRTSSRHGSLAAAVSWSFGLLDDDLQRVFTDISVFTGRFSIDDAAAITDTDPEAAARALTLLEERSLLIRTSDRRYLLLETLRAFGTDQLTASGRRHSVEQRHALHFVEWVADAERRLLGSGDTALSAIDSAIPELRKALAWLLDHHLVEQAGQLVGALQDYGFLRLRPDVLAWSERVIAADPEDASRFAVEVWVAAAYAAWMMGDVPESGVRSLRALEVAERSGRSIPPGACEAVASFALFEGRLDEAAVWYQRSADAALESEPQRRILSESSVVLALGYAGAPETADRAAALVARLDGSVTPQAAYAWYCAGEAVLETDLDTASLRLARAIELAQITNAAVVIGVAGATKASIDARVGDPETAAADYRQLLVHWRRAGMWSTQWTMLRSIAGLLARLGRYHDAAVLEGAVRSTAAGHRIFGADEVALGTLSVTLRAELGDGYEPALREGAMLDGEAAVEHALRSL